MERLELRFMDAEIQGSDDGTLKVSGYVNKTNQWSEELGQRSKFIERILPGTFDRALRNGNEVHFYAEHDPEKILASTRNGSLNLREDGQGLFMEAEITPTSWGRDYHTLIKSGIIRNMSFGMQVLKDAWEKRSDGTNERTISDIYLAEVSAVRNPAYSQSTIAARGIDVIEEVEIPNDIKNAENENREEQSNMANENTELRDAISDLTAIAQQILAKLSQSDDSQVDAEDVQSDEAVAAAVQENTEAIQQLTEEVQELTGVLDPEFEAEDEAEDAQDLDGEVDVVDYQAQNADLQNQVANLQGQVASLQAQLEKVLDRI